MNVISDPNNPDLEAGGRINDYRIVRIESLKEISSIFYELKHPGTGAKHNTSATAMLKIPLAWPLKLCPKTPLVLPISLSIPYCAVQSSIRCGIRFFLCLKEV